MKKRGQSPPGRHRRGFMKRTPPGLPEGSSAAGEQVLLPDYTVYELTSLQRMLVILGAGVLLFGIGYLFYHQLLLAALLVPGSAYGPRLLRRYLLQRRRAALNLQFKQMLFSLSSSLSAGRSVENAFREAVLDLRMLDPEGASDMISELNIICARMENGEPIEDALYEFSKRAGMEDVERFADVFMVCKRTGGDLVEIVRRTSTIIGEKLDIQQDIAVSIAQKKFEAKALLVSPLMMVMFMSLSAGDYMQPMYTGAGIAVSTLALIALFLCYLWTNKIMNIPL
ncbi:type II secretion system F family protein [Paenibacillus tritici]|uniref:type II secretion system F family protein n=1 Tax=Paenibacillus tritici TaxID=1873425 RepID=UPI003CCEF8A7